MNTPVGKKHEMEEENLDSEVNRKRGLVTDVGIESKRRIIQISHLDVSLEVQLQSIYGKIC